MLRQFQVYRTYTRLSRGGVSSWKPQPAQTPVSVGQLVELAKTRHGKLENAHFLHHELPKRLERRVIELQQLPYGLSTMKSIEKVKECYQSSFATIRTFPRLPEISKTTQSSSDSVTEEEVQFCTLLNNLLDKHRQVILWMAQAVLELKETLQSQDETISIVDTCPFLLDFLDRFFLARIGIRLLASHHVALYSPRPGFTGIFQKECNIKTVAHQAIEKVSQLCQREYGTSPQVQVYGNESLCFSYIPYHLHFILMELFKNSMKATMVNAVEKKIPSKDLPPIQLVIADGDNEVQLKISDYAGGIPRGTESKIFHYGYTSHQTSWESLEMIVDRESAPMAGFGYGLPLSRLYARCFGGDLDLLSMHGYGTDAFVYLPKLQRSVEVVPE